MKTKGISLFLSVSLLLVVSSCTLRPQADFTISGITYSGGDVMRLNNISDWADSYEWTMPDGSIVNATDAQYIIPLNQDDGILSFTLRAISKNGRKDDSVTKTIAVTSAKGQAIFWTDWHNTYGPVTVTINGTNSTIGSQGTPSAPPCMSIAGDGRFYDLKIGSYPYTATCPTKNWSGNITITKGGCATEFLP